MNTNGIFRAQYFDRQFLRTQDFTDEQDYHIQMRRRHNIAHHRWGIVAGLALSIQDKTSLFVEPGMAIDGYGREVIVSDPLPVPTTAFDQYGAETLDLWLAFRRTDADQAPSGYGACGADGASGYYRWREGALLLVTRADPDADRRKPPQVPVADQEFPPHRTPPDDPRQAWPVFLGQVLRTASDPAAYAVNLDNRPYVGLVGERIVTPDSATRIELGGDAFAVYTSEAEPVLEIDAAGDVTLRNDTSFLGNVTLRNGALEFVKGPGPEQTASAAYVAHVAAADEELAQELRIGMSSVAGAQVSIGVWSADEKAFHRCLTVRPNGDVVVAGDLLVGGALKSEGGKVDFPTERLTERAWLMAIASYQQGMTGAPFSGGTPPETVTPLALEIEAPMMAVAADDAGALADRLDGDPTALDALLEAVRARPELLARLRTGLQEDA